MFRPLYAQVADAWTLFRVRSGGLHGRNGQLVFHIQYFSDMFVPPAQPSVSPLPIALWLPYAQVAEACALFRGAAMDYTETE